MEKNVIKIGVIVETTPMKWRELEHVIAEGSSIIYVKKAPATVRLKIVETKGDLVRENVIDSYK
jgi:hypothetical protein